jgi:hypothetical protein
MPAYDRKVIERAESDVGGKVHVCWSWPVAQARFFEIKRCAGVDETSQPAGMMVPFGGTNQIVLETSGMDMHVTSNHPGIVVREFDGSGISTQLIDLNNSLY